VLAARKGCGPCKKRRIKCDEGEPVCLRCQKARIRCEYAAASSKQEESRSPPGTFSDSKVDQANDNGRALSIPRIDTSELSGLEVIYFDIFRNHVVENISICGHSDLWQRTILRESTRDESIRHCAVGIGALNKALRSQEGRRKVPLFKIPSSGHSSLTLDHTEAIRHYTKAIATFRDRLAKKGEDTPPRTILIMSILFIIYESMQGNTQNVDQLLTKAMLALKDTLTSLAPAWTDKSKIAAELDDEGILEAEYLLPRLGAVNGLSSPMYPSYWANTVHFGVRPPKSPIPRADALLKDFEYVLHLEAQNLAFNALSSSG
jgi:hypothetical protein